MNNHPRFKFYFEELGKSIPFYSMWDGGEYLEVDGETLLKYEYPIPPTPTYSTWLMMVRLKKRCSKCWAVIRSREDFNNHYRQNHAVHEEIKL